MRIRALTFLLILVQIGLSQIYNPADPFYMIQTEQDQLSNQEHSSSLILRPVFRKSNPHNWSLIVRNEVYFNNNAPNQENMGNRYIGKGTGFFTSINFSYSGRFLAFSIEPFYLTSQNKKVENPARPRPFTRLNDVRYHQASPYTISGLRESQIYLHYKGIGLGYSNANMWWGPGMHNTLTMTNNTTGFPHYMVGTIQEKRFRNLGLNARYTFAKLNNKQGNEAIYFTALVGTMTLYTEPIITFGFSRNYLSGGVDVGLDWTDRDAAILIFEGLFVKDLIGKDYTIDGHDPFDQTLAGFFNLTFPRSRFKFFLELGVNDHRQNWVDLRSQPDHSLASIVGFRKYGLGHNPNYVFGFEYTNLIQGRHWKFRATPNWYDRSYYDDFSYDGRRWTAHSGSDSDDFLIYFGYHNNSEWSLIPGFNYERHGVMYQQPAEVKLEFRLDIRYTYKGYRLNIYYEKEYAEHLGFPPDYVYVGEATGIRRTNTFWIGVERNLVF